MSILSGYWNPYGNKFASLLADLLLYSYESEFLDSLVRSGDRRLARSFNLSYRYIDDLIVFNNKRLIDYVKYIQHTSTYFNNDRLYTKLNNRRDDFNFYIVSSPFLSSNMSSCPSYGVYISQLIRYVRRYTYYDDFGYRHKLPVDKLLSQGHKVNPLRNFFQTFYGRYPDLAAKYQKSDRDTLNDSFPF